MTIPADVAARKAWFWVVRDAPTDYVPTLEVDGPQGQHGSHIIDPQADFGWSVENATAGAWTAHLSTAEVHPAESIWMYVGQSEGTASSACWSSD